MDKPTSMSPGMMQITSQYIRILIAVGALVSAEIR
jgi:hypothetical protein